MRKLSFYPKLAAQSMRNNRRFYVPYILTVVGTAAAYYILSALYFDPGRSQLAMNTSNGPAYVQSFMLIGMLFLAIFSFIFLVYTNSFLMKRRQRELGLYNVLGMGKGNIAMVLVFEALYIALLGIGGGLLAGILLHKLCVLILYRLIRFPAPFGISVQPGAVVVTLLLFAALIALTLLLNLARLGRSRPVELLRGGEVGEKEPKASWFLTLLGVISLGGGYFIAVWTRDGAMAVALYFIAVFLVVIGTYCLFTSVSIAVLKALRANRRYYYRPNHFIGVSGMLYRMKRNAAGLANICIISTMVMVMISGTLSLYMGTEDMIDELYPHDFSAKAVYYFSEPWTYASEEERTPFDHAEMNAQFVDWYTEYGAAPSYTAEVEYLYLSPGDMEDDGNSSVYALTAASYELLTGNTAPVLGEGEALARFPEGDEGGESVTLTSLVLESQDGEYVRREFKINILGSADISITDIEHSVAISDERDLILVVRDTQSLFEIGRALQRGGYTWEGFYDFEDLTDSEQIALDDAYWDTESGRWMAAADDVSGYYSYMTTDIRADFASDSYTLTGGFLFLGIFLGAVFLMAMVLIMYYKQVSEGYEDQRRFLIMRQVGLSERETRRAIHSQILTVFFLPIIVAAVHIAFDFNLVVQLLSLFQLVDVRLTALCTLGTLGVFCAVYAAIYLITARSYSRIVESGTRADVQ